LLLVDDEGELVFTIAERLGLRGYVVDAVTDGAAAIARARANEYDCAVVDVKMPGVSGLAVLQAIKDHRPRLPVIMLTGHGSADEGKEGMKLGACAYLFKPVNLGDLMAAIKHAMEGKGDA
jgi:DNA-binding response OmpR family regulator